MSQEIYKQSILPVRLQLQNIARGMLENDEEAEDAVQEVLLKLWYKVDLLGKYDNPAAMAVTAVKNHCLDKIKLRKRTESLTETTEFQTYSDSPYLLLERKNTEEILTKIIENLPKLQQMIIKMKDIEHYEVAEIAEITGTNEKAIRVNLSRARKKVREDYLKFTEK